MSKPILCIVGLGYVGLPLASAFARKGYVTHGFDVQNSRIEELTAGLDRTHELTSEQVKASGIHFSDNPETIKQADIVIVAVPTPVDSQNNPDLSLVENASRTVGKNLKPGAIVVFESTVYPGVTEEICGVLIEQESGLVCGEDFTLGYSPERINPGDKQHTVEKIVKIVAGQDAKTLDSLADLYGSIVEAGIHRAPSIKVAEMAKAIENAQRDINIAYINEVAMLCNHLGLRTKDVLVAAGTKWNFLRFTPGLVGGHCIGVDPYYLVEKARQLGMTTHLITAGRSVNDGVGSFVAERISDSLNAPVDNARILILGLTFKEDVPDTRNSKVGDVIKALVARGAKVEVHDPFANDEGLARQNLHSGSLEDEPYDAIALLVPHKEYRELPVGKLVSALKPGGLLYDLKSIVEPEEVTNAGRKYLSL